MNSLIKISALLFLVSCTTVSVQDIRGPDGTTNHLISCEYNVTDCYAKAAEICGKYKIVNTTADTSSLGGKSPTHTTTQLLVKCDK